MIVATYALAITSLVDVCWSIRYYEAVENHGEQVASEEQVAGIPKIIFHTSATPLNDYKTASKVTFVSFKSWQKFFPPPEYRQIITTEKDWESCVFDQFPDFKSHWANLEGIERADAGRLCLLYKHGGIYADLDYEVRTNFFQELNANPEKAHVLGACYTESRDGWTDFFSGNTTQVNTALLASRPRHPFWKLAFESMKLAGDEHGWHDPHGTGPRMITNLANDHLSLVNVLPCQNFQRVGDCGDFLELEHQKGIHWNIATWRSLDTDPKKRFNRNLLTEGFQKAHPGFGNYGLEMIDVNATFLADLGSHLSSLSELTSEGV